MVSQLPNNIAFKPLIKAQAFLRGRGASCMAGDSRCLAVVTMAPFIPRTGPFFPGPGRDHCNPACPLSRSVPGLALAHRTLLLQSTAPSHCWEKGAHFSMAGLTVPPALPLCSSQVRKPRLTWPALGSTPGSGKPVQAEARERRLQEPSGSGLCWLTGLVPGGSSHAVVRTGTQG